MRNLIKFILKFCYRIVYLFMPNFATKVKFRILGIWQLPLLSQKIAAVEALEGSHPPRIDHLQRQINDFQKPIADLQRQITESHNMILNLQKQLSTLEIATQKTNGLLYLNLMDKPSSVRTNGGVLNHGNHSKAEMMNQPS